MAGVVELRVARRAAKDGAGGLDRGRAVLCSDDATELLCAARDPGGLGGVRGGDVLALRIIGARPEIAELREGRWAADRAEGAGRVGANDRLRVDARSLGERVDIARVFRDRGGVHRRATDTGCGVHEVAGPRGGIVARAHEPAGADGAPGIFGVAHVVPRAARAHATRLDAHERRLGARGVVGFRTGGEGRVGLEGARQRSSRTRARVVVLGRERGLHARDGARAMSATPRRSRGSRAFSRGVTAALRDAKSPCVGGARTAGDDAHAVATTATTASTNAEARCEQGDDEGRETRPTTADERRLRPVMIVVARPDLVLNRRARHLAGEGRARAPGAARGGARGRSARARDDDAGRARRCDADHGRERLGVRHSRGRRWLTHGGSDGTRPRIRGGQAAPDRARAGRDGVHRRAELGRRSRPSSGRRRRHRGRGQPRARDRDDLVALRPTIRVTDDRGGERVGFIFGAGLVARFFDEYYAASHQGYAGAAAIVARVFAGSLVASELARRVLEPVAATLTVDGVEASARAFSLVLASVVRDVGLHIRVTPRGGETMGAFHAVASPLGPRALGPQMPRVLAGRKLLGRDHVDAPCAREPLAPLRRRTTPTSSMATCSRRAKSAWRSGPPIDASLARRSISTCRESARRARSARRPRTCRGRWPRRRRRRATTERRGSSAPNAT